MLKAFSFSESNPNDIPADADIWIREKEIMIGQVSKTIAMRGMIPEEEYVCPVCGGKGNFIFRKYEVDYYRCDDCCSIYQPVTDEELDFYYHLSELEEYRKTEMYQTAAAEQRTGQWIELLDWLKFRTYRYLGTNKDLIIADFDNFFDGFRDRIEQSDFCKLYREESIRKPECFETEGNADLALFMATIQQSKYPLRDLERVRQTIRSGGLIFISSRIGTGFDILTLRENAERIFPYTHVLLPSLKGMEIVLKKAGFKVLETITPGNYDFSRVAANKAWIRSDDYFLRYMFDPESGVNLEEFQRFLQKNRLSSYAQIIAQKI